MSRPAGAIFPSTMIDLKVPPLGESITEATVARWNKNEGDAIAPGETVVELETDKINVEVPAQKGGVLARRVRNEGDVVKLGETLGIIDESRGAAATAGPARVAPSAQRLADETGVSLAGISGTGRGGVVSKPDVIEQGRKAESQPAPGVAQSVSVSVPSSVSSVSSRETREKMTTRRKRIAENLLQAQHATAHLTTFNEIDMSAITALRDRMKEKVEKEHGVKLSFMPFFAKAACLALKAFPTVNAQIDGDSIIYKHYVNLGIAVASDAGLVVPNLKDADRKGVLDICARHRRRRQEGARRQADDGRPHRRHVHRHQRRRLRLAALHADHQLPAGRHPRAAQDAGPPGGRRRRGGHSPDDVRRAVVRPPHHRRPAGRALPRAGEGADGRSGRDADRVGLHTKARRSVAW